MFGIGLVTDAIFKIEQQIDRKTELKQTFDALFSLANHDEKIKLYNLLYKK